MEIPDWLSIVADASSVLGLAITAVVWYQTRLIKKTLLKNARVPEAKTDLAHLASLLLSLLKEWPESEKEINALLSRIEAILSNMLPKLTSPENKRALRAQMLITKRNGFWGGWGSKDLEIRNKKVWEIHGEVAGTIEALQQLNKDYRKRI